MKYREIDYSIGDNGNGRWGWKLHPKIRPDGIMREIISGEAGSQDGALVMIKAAIDKMLGPRSD